MSTVQVITEVIYYTIDNSLNFHAYDNFGNTGNSDESKFIIRKNIGYNSFQSNAGDLWQNYAANMEFLDENGNSVSNISENDWKFEMDHFGMTGGYSYTTMWIKFTDSFGFSGRETFNISIEGFIDAYKRFQRLNKFDGYKYAKLSIENEELVVENSALKEKLNDLTLENIKLKSKLSAVS
ncbi:cell division protein ZapB [Mucilaginibacter sp. McL0603]|uniref:cell division protein ZapB n=1 Tax=Mucilaginibacter sp. McL0603 TaxID=3415670 RepID=UPI003CEC547C